MTAFLIVLAVIFSIALFVFLLSIDLIISYSGEEGFNVKFRVLGKVLEGNKSGDENSPILEKIKRLLGLSHLENADAVKTAVSEKGAAETVKKTFSVFKIILENVIKIIKRCQLIQCKITSIGGGDDAAISYGIACATVYPLVAYLENVMSVKRDAFNLCLRCDYSLPETQNEIYTVIRIRVIYILGAFLSLARRNLAR